MLKLDEAKLRRQVEAGDVPEVGQFDPSDELHGLISAAQDSTQDGGAAITATAGETISIYPESNSEDRPIVAVSRGCLTLLGHEWKLPEDGDGATEATVEAVADVVQAANALLDTLDRQDRAGNRPAEAAHLIALGVPREDEWGSAAGFMEYVCGMLDRFGVERPEHYPDDFDVPR
jgi:hypothetical protein